MFRQLHHLNTLEDKIKIMYLQVLNYYVKNAPSTEKILSKLLKFCIWNLEACQHFENVNRNIFLKSSVNQKILLTVEFHLLIVEIDVG